MPCSTESKTELYTSGSVSFVKKNLDASLGSVIAGGCSQAYLSSGLRVRDSPGIGLLKDVPIL